MDYSKLWALCSNDWIKGLIVAIITTPLTIIYQSVSAGTLIIDWKTIIAAALTGGIAYLLKNLSTGSGGQILTNKEIKNEKK